MSSHILGDDLRGTTLLSVHLAVDAWQHQVLRCLVVDKLPLADMLLLLVRDPHLVVESTPLALLVREGAEPVGARVELTGSLQVGKLAVRDLALAAVPARRHCRVPEGAVRVLAVGEELAILLALVGDLSRGGRVPADALAVLARHAEGADVAGVDRGAGGRCRGLMGEFAVFVCAFEVVLANRVFRVRRFPRAGVHVDVLGHDMAPGLGCRG